MAYFQEISFFHDCGDTENHVWSVGSYLPAASTRRVLPLVDKVFFHPLEEGNLEQVTEVHYQERSCSVCEKDSDEGSPPVTPIGEQANVLSVRRALWHEIVSSFKLQLDQLKCKAERAAEDVAAKLLACLAFEREVKKLRAKIQEREERQVTESNSVQLSIEFGTTEPYLSNLGQDYISFEASIELEEAESRLLDAREDVGQAKQRITVISLEETCSLTFRDLRQLEERGGVPPRERTYVLAQGWNTGLLTIASAPLDKESKDDQCSICLLDLYSPGRCRRLPCGHLWHRDCLKVWLHDKDTSPICRAEYKILRLELDDLQSLVDFRSLLAEEELGLSFRLRAEALPSLPQSGLEQ